MRGGSGAFLFHTVIRAALAQNAFTICGPDPHALRAKWGRGRRAGSFPPRAHPDAHAML